MIATDLGRALLIGSFPVAYAFDALTFPHMLVVAFLMGTLSVLFHVSYSSLFVALVPRDRFVEGGSIMHGSRALSYIAGPSIGGVLVQALTAPVTLVVDACSYVVSALFLRGVEVEEPATEAPGKGHVVAGIRWVFGDPIVRAALGATATINFFNFVFFALFILYATKSLDVPPGTLGLVLGAGAVGGVLGAVVTGRVARRIGIGPAFALGCIVFPAPLLLVPLAAGPRWVVLGCLFLAEFGSGLGVMMLDISVGAIFAAVIPDRLRSRVSGRLHGRELRRPPAGRARRRRARDAGSDSGRRCGSRPRARSRASSGSCRRRSSGSGSCRSPRTAAASSRSVLSIDSLASSAASLVGLPGVVGLVLRLAPRVLGLALLLAALRRR